ncbi:MAG: ArsA-related P-loop ATPase [Desulfobacteraceae bacterium]
MQRQHIKCFAAHNLSDIFQVKLSNRVTKVHDTLFAREVDQETIIRAYLNTTRDALKRSYAYLSAFNLDGYFDILKHSPGLEEYALVMAFQSIIEKNRDFDCVIFDMPPTALSLKFFNLPFLSRQWIEHLKTLREEINEKKKIVSRIKLAGKAYTKDKILGRIDRMKAQYLGLEKIFQNSETTDLFVVLNNNPLAVTETRRIVSDLEAKKIFIKQILWNREMKKGEGEEQSLFPGYAAHLSFPEAGFDLFGVGALGRYLDENGMGRPGYIPFGPQQK